MLWATGDTHFGHKRMIEKCHRPFSSLEEMDEALIANWNAVVKPNHDVYLLGDFVVSRTADPVTYRKRLHGRIHLVIGNHDDTTITIPNLFTSVQHIVYLKYNHQRIFMSHYAHRVWRKSNHGSFHIYGHSHGDLPNWGRSTDVGVDARNYRPVLIEDIMNELEPYGPTFHHKQQEV